VNQIVETEILDAEDRLRTAMLSSDESALDSLLAPELIFTNHFGRLLSKDHDLAAYRSGILKVNEAKPTERRIVLINDVAIVSVRMQIIGTYGGTPANGDFRFTRVWGRSPDKTWHVVAAHSSTVA
jgi:hypothetical protein